MERPTIPEVLGPALASKGSVKPTILQASQDPPRGSLGQALRSLHLGPRNRAAVGVACEAAPNRLALAVYRSDCCA